MILYVVWYYWYKNIWDELLLLWLLSYYQNFLDPKIIVIKSWDVLRLESRLAKHSAIIQALWVTADIQVSLSIPLTPYKDSVLVIWWGEVITDARSFPYNWRNHFARYAPHILFWKTIITWWIWTIKKRWTSFLYRLLFSQLDQIIVREQYSYNIVKPFFDKVVLHRDYALDVLDVLDTIVERGSDEYIIINLNTHIRNKETKQKIVSAYKNHIINWERVYYIPWAMWDDDDDVRIYHELNKECPDMILYDRTIKDLYEICKFVAWANKWYVTRLHIALLCKYFWVSIDTIVYQEKVNRFLSS